jgi:hypothetical protein
MTDRELLELAAKAAGMDVHWGSGWESDYMFRSIPRPSSPLVANVRWNPLANDEDALRLAVKLKLIVTFADGGAGPHVCAGKRPGPFSNEKLPIKMFALDEERAATRRAIVRAAAEIGKEKNT